MTSSVSSVSTTLNGFFRPGFTSQEKVVIDITQAEPTPGTFLPTERPAVTMFDGRALQEQEQDGQENFESRFFNQHGFVLLNHQSQVENWDSGATPPADGIDLGVSRDMPAHKGENEIETKYHAEVDSLIREHLLPNRNLDIQQYGMLLRRGKNTANPFFGEVVHNDYGLTADDYEENVAAFGNEEQAKIWRDAYERDEVIGYMVINFWRTVHMTQPLQHMPLGVLDSSSVELDDVVSSGLKGFSTTGRITNQLSLRFSQGQRWYYYPRMTTEEVLALNLFECYKDDSQPRVYNSYHSAFPEPNPIGDVEERQSSEHRVNVFILKE